jgi:twitching motility protein PilI
MANKDALKALQHRLAERLRLARELPPTRNWLAVESAGHGFLLPLAHASEIFPMVALQAVAHCQPWFLGIGNLRGQLHAVVDLAAFIGLPKVAGHRAAASRTPDFRGNGHLVAMGNTLQINAALLVDRLLGIRKPDELKASPQTGTIRPHFVIHEWLDTNGRIWYELNLAALATDEVFLKVAA